MQNSQMQTSRSVRGGLTSNQSTTTYTRQSVLAVAVVIAVVMMVAHGFAANKIVVAKVIYCKCNTLLP